MKRATLLRIADALQRRHALAVVTRLADGAQCVVEWGKAGGEAAGVADGDLSLAEPQRTAVVRLLASGQSATLPGDDTLFVRCHVPAPRLIIVGAVHIAQALAPMAASAGFDVAVIDPRGAFASPSRFPGVALLDEWPDVALARLGLDAATAIVALSHDPKLDDPALHLALPSQVFYIGALGSRRTHEKRLARLREAGLGEFTGRIHSPIGLDLGGRAPAEIAVSILAEVIQVRYRHDS